MSLAITPVSACTAIDPYPFYDHLRDDLGFYYDAVLKLWVASSAADISAVLSDANCRVRPATEPVPQTLHGSTAGQVFGNLVRMNDGEKQQALKKMMASALAQLSEEKVRQKALYWSERLYQEILPGNKGNGLSDFCYRLPTYVMADLIGIEHKKLGQVTQWVGQFIRCIAPGGTAQQIALGQEAAAQLYACMAEQLAQAQTQAQPQAQQQNLLSALARIAQETPAISTEQVIANSIGLLSQTYEASAGLISNAVLLLAGNPALRQSVQAQPELLGTLINENSRFDPSIQNTRRFVLADSVVAGQPMRAGDVILLVLAAANRDPAVNPHPARFDLHRSNAKNFAFSAAAHACPGQASAHTIATAGLGVLFEQGFNFERVSQPARYRASMNARVAELEML